MSIIHNPSPRECGKLKPFLIIVSGMSGSGKSTLSKAIIEGGNFVYFSTDTFTVDPNLPIEELQIMNKKSKGKIIGNIWNLRNIVYDNQDIFINYCYDKIMEQNTNTVIDGAYFVDNKFLRYFKYKFQDNFKIWVVT